MIFRWSIVSSLAAMASANSVANTPTEIKADSSLGSKLLSRARRLDDAEFAWVADYSVKFQGCHHSLAWNEEADDAEDARIYNQRLVRFRLCPSGSCVGDSSSSGCDSSSAGEYVVDLGVFVDAYTEAKMEAQEYNCEVKREYCQDYECANANDDDVCEAQCLTNAGMSECVEDEDEEEFEVQRYLECAEFDGGGRRRLDGGNGVAYYIGPYCSDDGASVYLGLFTDETCSVPADSGTYETLMYGKSLPYSSESIVGLDCVDCKEPQDQNDNDGQDADEVIEMCEQLYEQAGKCESNLAGTVYYPSEDACTFIQGIQITRADGSVSVQTAPSKTAGAFVGIFAVTTILLGAYVYYLKSKLDRSRVNLGSE